MALKFSLIIATLNAGKRLERALSSIFGQTWPEYEVIVQDGGSDTLDLPARYAGRVSLSSAPDCGIYDAWNRAVERASGDWGLFLGADDRLLDVDVLARCARHLETLPEGIVFAYGDLIEGSGFWRRFLIRRSLRTVYTMMTDTIGLPFPSTFTRMSALKTHRFDTSFRIAGDHEFTARLVTADNVARLPVAVTFMGAGGISDSSAQAALLREERVRVLNSRTLEKAREIVAGCIRHRDERPWFSRPKRLWPWD